ncbi:MAG: substrate-binding domain-containing protein [Eubacterium sp.]|nr:substrate-binding domain-containing protein [Eubacterium sp.]
MKALTKKTDKEKMIKTTDTGVKDTETAEIRENDGGSKGRVDKYGIYIGVILLFFVTAIVLIAVYINSRLKEIDKDHSDYRYHYAYISKSEDSYTANHIYDEARNYGKQKNIYVEKLKTNSSANYTDADYVQMAAAMKVDGIIVEGSEDNALKESINAAEKEGIPTVTLLSDCSSERKSFVEIGDYNLGREFARTVINIANKRSLKVTVFVDGNGKENDEVVEALKETFTYEGNHLSVELSIEKTNGLPNFRLLDMVKELLSDASEKPDFLICVGEHDTKIVYQAIRDYNLAGKTHIIGYGISDPLLKGVRDQEIDALIDADAGQMGMLCVDALVKYNERGSCNDHIIVDDTVVTKNNVERYLDED